MNGSAFVLLVMFALLGLLAHWAAAKLREARHRHRLLGLAWAVLAVAAFVTLVFVFPAGQVVDPQIHHCDVQYPDCPD
jgi:hypothetical protein